MKLILTILFILIIFCGYSQNRFPSIDSAKNYVLRYIKNSAVESFTNLRMQNSIYGTLQLLDSVADNSGFVPTLQQVTTAGNSTTDSINIKDGTKNLSVLTKEFTGSSYYSGTLLLNSNTNTDYVKFNHNRILKSNEAGLNTMYFPDTSGTIAVGVKFGNNYMAANNGIINLDNAILNGSANLDFSNTSAQSSSDLTITVIGANIGDPVYLGVPNGSVLANSSYSVWVSTFDTVTVRFNNYSSSSQDPALGTFKVKIFK